MLKHPQALERVQREADALFAAGTIGPEDLRRIPSIDGAIMEAMRLYPIAVAQMRTATRDFEFLGHRIREGELLFVATSVPHFMAEYFPNPEVFDINRYEKPRAEHLKPGVYSPYGRGPHTCLGKSLAEVQMAISMARLPISRRRSRNLNPSAFNCPRNSSALPFSASISKPIKTLCNL